ncbi:MULTISPECIES: hypothetical protein [unclassified Bacillus (in: firmicutes)]|uniref:hypothetical protein n=1 Tax=unclassified Bacillus (in: firmicutes) TaxID=185979 RepID=UPI000B883288|nr:MULTISPECIES: hypothetical protein [unclassified Bacillus (in: firmicutes)]
MMIKADKNIKKGNDFFCFYRQTELVTSIFVADGFVARNFQQIGFAKKEIELLVEIRNELGSYHRSQFLHKLY